MTVKKIIVVGAGAAGYIAAAAFQRNIPNVAVTVIRDPAVPIIGVGEALAWNAPAFMKDVLGLTDEDRWIKATDSTYKLSLQFKGFDGTDRPYYTGSAGHIDTTTMGKYFSSRGIHLFDLWKHLRYKGLLDKLGTPRTSYNVLTAKTFWHSYFNTMPERHSLSNLTDTSLYSYHINAQNIGNYVHDHVGKPAGVKEIAVRVRDVRLNAQGHIDHLLLDDETEHRADLYVDSTGFAKVLASRMAAFEFQHEDEFSNNSAIVGPHKYQDPSEIVNYTQATAMDHGWHFSVPSAQRSGEGYIFNSRLTPDVDQLADEYFKKFGHKTVNFKRISWEPGYYNRSFTGNCVLLGLSSGFVDPWDANGFTSVTFHINTLIHHLKQDSDFKFQWQDKYNSKYSERNEDVLLRNRGFFELNLKTDSDYWRQLSQNGREKGTMEKLREIYCQRRPELTKIFLFAREALSHNIDYYNIPEEPSELNLDKPTEMLALAMFNKMIETNKLTAAQSMSTGSYYQRLR